MSDINKNNTSNSGDGPSSSSSSSGGPSSSNNSSSNNNNTKSSGGSALSLATYGAINTKDCSTPMWMVRITPKLADLWQNLPEGTELGTLTFTKGSSTSSSSSSSNKRQKISSSTPPKKEVKQSLIIDVNPDLTSSSSDSNVVPLEYSCEALTKKVPTYHPFSRDTTTASITVHGTVTRTCNLQMMRHSSSYRKMCQNRIYQHVHSTRFVKPVDAADLTLNRRSKVAQVGFGDSIAKTGKRLLEAAARVTSGTTGIMSAATNAAAIGEKSTQGVVFDLFSQQPFWTVKELRSASGGLIPEKDIRAVLAEVAEFRRSGEHKGMWELKSEYRKLENNNDNNNNNNNDDDDNDDDTATGPNTNNNSEGNHSDDKSNNNSQDGTMNDS